VRALLSFDRGDEFMASLSPVAWGARDTSELLRI